MPIGTHYGTSQIQPGVIHFHGLVTVDGDGEVDAPLSETPGVTWTQQSTGVYRCTFNDGAQVGLVAFTATSVTNGGPALSVGIPRSGPNFLNTGSLFFDVQTRTSGGALADPDAFGGLSYVLVRTNSGVKIT